MGLGEACYQESGPWSRQPRQAVGATDSAAAADSSCKVLCGNQFASLAAEGDDEIEGGALLGAVPVEELVAQDPKCSTIGDDLRHDLAAIDAMEWATDAYGGRSFAYVQAMAARAGLVQQLAELAKLERCA